jgi:hypothetical protein
LDRRGYSAFISYSHHDTKIAADLQKRLERYRLPRATAISYGIADPSLGQIFRDREDLAAAPSLSDAIREGLSQSRALIVVCSPAAAASRWVEQEIQLFRSLHPDRPVLAALVDGDPASAFPAALTQNGIEPLAADLRKSGDGAQLGFLKIVAGMAGVPLDTLIQREAQRKLRRVTAITLGAIAAMLIMAVMTTLALSSRNEAARQRAEAEGLVEYMLTDLRGKLKGVNRIEIMDGVNDRAMAHYSKQGDLAKLPADSLERRARILHAMGEDEDRRGNLDQAIAKFREAHRTTQALLAQEPGNADRIFAHAQSEYWVGFAAWRKTDAETAGKYWRGYLDQAQALANAEPDSVRSDMELGFSHGNMCELLMDKNRDVKSGLEHCRQSIAFERRAVVKDPANSANQMALANRLGWMADAQAKTGDFAAATAFRNSEQKLIDSLAAKDEKNVELQVRQLWPQIGLGKIAESQKRPDEAGAILSRVLVRLDVLSNAFPDDFHVLEYRIRTNLILARANRAANRPVWRTYRNAAAVLIQRAEKLKKGGLPRMAALLNKFDGRE